MEKQEDKVLEIVKNTLNDNKAEDVVVLDLKGNARVSGANLDELNAKLTGNGVSAAGLPSTNLTLTAKANGENADKINFTALLDSTLLKISKKAEKKLRSA